MSTVRRSRRSSAKVDSRGLAEVAKKLSPPESKQSEKDSSSEVKVQSPECEKGVWSQCEELCQRLPGRQSQVEMLLTLFGEPSSPTPSPLHLYGNTGTGKTLTIKTLLEMLQAPHVLINCIECYNLKVLFGTVLSRLVATGKKEEGGGGGGTVNKCDTLYGFVRELQRLVKINGHLSRQTLYIVLDKAERLREMEVNTLSALLRLKELSCCEVCVVTVSVLPYERLTSDSCPSQLLTIHFPDYSQAETLAIMALDRSSEDSPEFYTTFSNHIWNVFHIVSRDLAELRHLAAVLYPKYKAPVTSGEIDSNETRRLWRHIEPFFKDIMSKIYLREISTQAGGRVMATPTSCLGGSVTAAADYLELPHYSKYLLLSSYLASYNPARADKKFFSKVLNKERDKEGELIVHELQPFSELVANLFPVLS